MAEYARLKWAHLSQSQRKLLSNGCGGKGGPLNPPDFCFTASCDHHDFHYWRGGDEAERKKADSQFLAAMLVDASRLPWYRRPAAQLAARLFWLAVRMWGGKFFHYGVERGWNDLIQISLEAARTAQQARRRLEGKA